jgi:hypothetical protein
MRNTLPKFRVIDVENECIVKSNLQERYLTLSYAWGLVPTIRLQRENIDDLMSIGALARIRHQLPHTIRDAIDLVRMLDERYICIDSLCLIEDDPDDLLSGVKAMDITYEACTLTIIAATGIAVQLLESRAVVEEIDSGFSLMVCQTLTRALDNSKYSTRGWT